LVYLKVYRLWFLKGLQSPKVAPEAT
jgi:hypothetical protein